MTKDIAIDIVYANKVIELRRAGGQAGELCPTCGCKHDEPSRRVEDGRIIGGCVDPCHGKHLEVGSDSYKWHFRPDALAFRRSMYDMIVNLP